MLESLAGFNNYNFYKMVIWTTRAVEWDRQAAGVPLLCSPVDSAHAY